METATQTALDMPPIAINRELPWGEWPTPEVHSTAINQLRVRANDGGTLYLGTEDGSDEANRTILGVASRRGLQELSWKVGFDSEFVLDKLTPALAAEVINHRISAHREAEVGVIVEGDRFSAFLPSMRELLTYGETAQSAYDTMNSVFGNVLVDGAWQTERGMRVRLMTDLQQPITRRVGDVLQMGLEVRQDYGESIEVELYMKRLVCLNGMTANRSAFSWQNRLEGSRNHQRLWLSNGIAEALGAYDTLVERSRLMAQTRFEGEPESALRERARAMNFPLRHMPALMAAFEEEPGHSEWELANAFTRVATHAGLPDGLGRRVQENVGVWTQGFDLCTARLPRPLAMRVGAQIIADIETLAE